jgi:hypothetical protein
VIHTHTRVSLNQSLAGPLANKSLPGPFANKSLTAEAALQVSFCSCVEGVLGLLDGSRSLCGEVAREAAREAVRECAVAIPRPAGRAAGVVS